VWRDDDIDITGVAQVSSTTVNQAKSFISLSPNTAIRLQPAQKNALPLNL